MAETIGLIAGNGTFPKMFVEAAKRQGYRVVAVGIHGGLTRVRAITVRRSHRGRTTERVEIAVDKAADRIESITVLVDRVVRDFGRARVDGVVGVVAVCVDC